MIMCSEEPLMSTVMWVFSLTERKTRWYPKEMTDIDYAKDLAIATNPLKEAGFLLHKSEQVVVASEIDLDINASKTDYMSYNQSTFSFLVWQVLMPLDVKDSSEHSSVSII